MKTRISKLIRFLPVLYLTTWALVPCAPAQNIGLAFSAGHAILTVTGTAGTVYSIQYTSNLSPTNHWAEALVQVQGASVSWTDPATPPASQRFYRVAPVPPPADTNLVFIQPGTFTMGSPSNEVDRFKDESPQTAVTISRGFWMEKFFVTQGNYLAVVGSNPSFFNGVRNGTDYGTDLTRPVEEVSWDNATNYCGLRTKQERAGGLIPTNYVYRLPTEAEWEFTCRAGTTTRFSYGDDSGYTNLTYYAWYYDNSGGTTHPVGQKLANPWGLYDMHGDLMEFCQDWYGAYPAGIAVDPQGPVTGSSRVLRNGYWHNAPWVCRSASRSANPPAFNNNFTGFRVVLAPGQ